MIDRITIGEHTVIGAGSTVLHDQPSCIVAFGTPARKIHDRHPATAISKMPTLELPTQAATGYSLTAAQLALLPSDDDVARYEAEGYYISKPGVIPDELINAAIQGAERFYRGDLDAKLPVETGYSNTVTNDPTLPRNNEFVSLQYRSYATLRRTP